VVHFHEIMHLEQGYYNIPLHEMLRAVIYGDNIHYSPLNTEIINLFDVRTEKKNDHFIIPQLIGILYDQSKNSRNHGFVELPEIYSKLQGLGYTTTQIDLAVQSSYSKGLFEISQKGDRLDIENNNLKIRATNLSMYHFQFLSSFFTYIDSIIVDTPIMDDEFKEKISDSLRINERLSRAKIFLDYLDSIWQESNFNPSYFDWIAVKGKVENDIGRISEAIKKEH